MTLAEWLDARQPAPPPGLCARLRTALGPAVQGDASTASEACLAAAEQVVATLLRGDCTSRASALDLLAADALVTYAFEGASEAPAQLVERAAAAMRRMAALGSARTCA